MERNGSLTLVCVYVWSIPRFLTILEIIIYYICMALGGFNIYKLRTDPVIIEDPFEISPELEL